MLRVPNVPLQPEDEPATTDSSGTLPGSGGQPRPRKAYAPDDPSLGDLDKPGADADVLPAPPLGQYGSF